LCAKLLLQVGDYFLHDGIDLLVVERLLVVLQRLTRIKQVGLSSVVYPGAQHTRFQHSLGAFYLMSEAITQLASKGNFIFDSEAEAVQAAILLHDIGHGPFSHVLEDTIVKGVSHEEISLMLMERMNKEMNGQLSLAIQIFKDEYPKRFLHQLVSGQLDMDRLDYLRRDSFYNRVFQYMRERAVSYIMQQDGSLHGLRFTIKDKIAFGGQLGDSFAHQVEST
jgi:HD superfamily phosphohydrolase